MSLLSGILFYTFCCPLWFLEEYHVAVCCLVGNASQILPVVATVVLGRVFVLVRVSIAPIKYHGQKQLWEKGLHIHITVY